MEDNRRYLRLVCDKILRQNAACMLFEKIVKFYYTLFSHPLKSLKFEKNMPISNMKECENRSFNSIVNKTTF